jgi:hypothetical protein
VRQRRRARAFGNTRRQRAVPGLLAVLAAVVLAGLVVRVGNGGERREPRRATPAPSPVVAGGPVRVRVPPGWSAGGDAPRVPGLTLNDPVVLANRTSGVQAVVGTLPATSATLLPAGFLAGMRMDLPRPSTVRIGTGLEGYHYAGLVHPQVRRPLDLYAVPTTRGTVTAACLAETVDSLLDGCWSVVSSLAIASGLPLPADPNAAFREVLADRVAAVDAVGARALGVLKAAVTPAEQARAFAPLPGAYRDAAVAAAALAPSAPQWPRRIVASLRATATGYERVQESLAHADRLAYEAAQKELRGRRAHLLALLRRYSTGPTAEAQR